MFKRKRAYTLWKGLCLLCVCVFAASMLFADLLRVKGIQAADLGLPEPMQLLEVSSIYSYPVLKGMKINPENPLELEFFVDHADADEVKPDDISRLVSYFLAVLTVPQDNLWVNLSPYEHDRIVPQSLGVTELGKDLLAQDYILKQLSSSLTHPDTDTGGEYWDNMLENPSLSVASAFNKVWIVPDQAGVQEYGDYVMITSSSLGLMTEHDYLSSKSSDLLGDLKKDAVSTTVEITKETILPELTDDVNHGENFARLRQVYSAMILGFWFKEKFKESFYADYIDKNKVTGIDLEDPKLKDKIYQIYLEAFKKGVYDVVRQHKVANGSVGKRRFFSGGFDVPQDFNFEKSVADSAIEFGQNIFDTLIGSELEGVKVQLVQAASAVVDRPSNEEIMQQYTNIKQWLSANGINEQYNGQDRVELTATGALSLDLTDAGLNDLKILENWTGIEVLVLKDNDIEDVKSLSKLQLLKAVILNNTKVKDVKALRKLELLELLHLAGTEVENSESFADFKALEELNLTGTKIKNLNPLLNVTTLKDLILLGTPNLSYEQISGFWEKYLKEYPNNNLRIVGRQKHDIGAKEFKVKPKAEDIVQIGMTEEEMKRAEEDRAIINLEQEPILLIKNEVKQQLASIEDWLSSNEISLESNGKARVSITSRGGVHLNLADANLEDIGFLSAWPDIEVLNLDNNYNLKIVDTVSSLEKIRILSLNKTAVSDLDVLAELDTLEILSVANTNVKGLIDVVGLNTLKELNFNGNFIDDLTPVLGLDSLERLVLLGAKGLSEEQVEKFWNGHPRKEKLTIVSPRAQIFEFDYKVNQYADTYSGSDSSSSSLVAVDSKDAVGGIDMRDLSVSSSGLYESFKNAPFDISDFKGFSFKVLSSKQIDSPENLINNV